MARHPIHFLCIGNHPVGIVIQIRKAFPFGHFSQTATAVRERTRHNHSNFPSTFEPWYHECKTLLMRLIADRDDDAHGHVDEPSVGVLLSWLIIDDNNDDDHDGKR